MEERREAARAERRVCQGGELIILALSPQGFRSSQGPLGQYRCRVVGLRCRFVTAKIQVLSVRFGMRLRFRLKMVKLQVASDTFCSIRVGTVHVH